MKIWFVDFWEGFDVQYNIFVQILSKHYDIIIEDDPDILFYSCFGHDNIKYNCTKIYYCGENMPSANGYSIDMNKSVVRDNHLYFPLYALNEHYDYKCIENLQYDDSLYDRKLCSAVVSSPVNDYRNRMIRQNWVDGRGFIFNKRIPNKEEFISQYKFNLAMENSNSYGYCTEKIVDAFKARTIPIYWGNQIPPEDFNANSYIYLPNITDIYSYISNMSKEEYMQILKAPKFSKTIPDYHVQLEQFLLKIINENDICNNNGL